MKSNVGNDDITLLIDEVEYGMDGYFDEELFC